mgnify:CR=1 FL=1
MKTLENDNPLLLGMDLPYSLEAEQSVLGAVLVEPGCLSELVERLESPISSYPVDSIRFFASQTSVPGDFSLTGR